LSRIAMESSRPANSLTYNDLTARKKAYRVAVPCPSQAPCLQADSGPTVIDRSLCAAYFRNHQPFTRRIRNDLKGTHESFYSSHSLEFLGGKLKFENLNRVDRSA